MKLHVLNNFCSICGNLTLFHSGYLQTGTVENSADPCECGIHQGLHFLERTKQIFMTAMHYNQEMFKYKMCNYILLCEKRSK